MNASDEPMRVPSVDMHLKQPRRHAMLTPYTPPLARIELLRVRRVDPSLPADDSRPSLLRDPGDLAFYLPARIDRSKISDEARRLLDDDVSVHTQDDHRRLVRSVLSFIHIRTRWIMEVKVLTCAQISDGPPWSVPRSPCWKFGVPRSRHRSVRAPIRYVRFPPPHIDRRWNPQ